MTRPARPVDLAVKIGFLLLALGLVGWLFTTDWRFAVAGVLALLVAAVFGAPASREKP